MTQTTYKLSDIADVIDCEHKTAPTIDKSEYYSIRTPDIKNGRLLYEKANRVSLETYIEWTKRGIPEQGDIILAREAPVGEVGKIDNSHNVCLGQRTVLIKIKSSEIFCDYLLYSFVSPSFKKYLQELSGGSVVAHLNMKDIRNLEFTFPSLIEQKAIASVLSSLDEKIDLLHRQNKTLESMAETLFRQWLYNEQQDNLKEGKLSDILSLKYGKALKQENRSGEGFPVVASGGIVGFHNEYLVSAPGIVIGRKGTLGKVYYMYENFYPIDTSYYIESKIKNSKLFYEYFLLKSLGFENMNSDSAVPGLNRDSAMSSPITLPSFEMIVNFNSFCEDFFKKIKINLTQIKTLEKLRDTLLPKLMNGEVRVQYAEEAIASVA